VSLSFREDDAGLEIKRCGAAYLLIVDGKTVWLYITSSLNKKVHSIQTTKGKEERIGGFRVCPGGESGLRSQVATIPNTPQTYQPKAGERAEPTDWI
jgi:hypothetical protein